MGSEMCIRDRSIPSKSGKFVSAPTAMLADRTFIKISSKIKGYNVSSDGQILTLLDAEGVELGVFKRAEAAQ